MKKTIFKNITYAFIAVAAISISSCVSDDEETIVIEKPSTGIPDDSQADPNPELTKTTTYVPNIQTNVDYVNGVAVIRVDMTGVKNPDGTEWLRLYGTGNPNQNIWVEVDDKPKGIDVYNNADDNADNDKIIKTDVVFTVDNSGSMDDEADAIARDIIAWATLLKNSRLDVKFGVVGYGGFISGAINLTDVQTMSAYLNKYTGTSRTSHFGGSDAKTLENAASAYTKTGSSVSTNECVALAIRFASDYFSFRNGATRIYVNFTDEPNQPNGKSGYSVKYFENQDNWKAADGTVHTVYSDRNTNYSNRWNYEEQPWLISDYTGGTTIFAPSNFSGVTLESLPVTGAMENSYIIRFTNIVDLLDGKSHKVHITIRSKDGSVAADKTFYVTFKEEK